MRDEKRTKDLTEVICGSTMGKKKSKYFPSASFNCHYYVFIFQEEGESAEPEHVLMFTQVMSDREPT